MFLMCNKPHSYAVCYTIYFLNAQEARGCILKSFLMLCASNLIFICPYGAYIKNEGMGIALKSAFFVHCW